MEIDPKFVSMKRAAERSGLTYDYIRKLARTGVLEVFSVDDRIRLVNYESLEKHLREKGRKKAQQENA